MNALKGETLGDSIHSHVWPYAGSIRDSLSIIVSKCKAFRISILGRLVKLPRTYTTNVKLVGTYLDSVVPELPLLFGRGPM